MTIKELRDMLSLFPDDTIVMIVDNETGDHVDISEVLSGPYEETPNQVALQITD